MRCDSVTVTSSDRRSEYRPLKRQWLRKPLVTAIQPDQRHQPLTALSEKDRQPSTVTGNERPATLDGKNDHTVNGDSYRWQQTTGCQWQQIKNGYQREQMAISTSDKEQLLTAHSDSHSVEGNRIPTTMNAGNTIGDQRQRATSHNNQLPMAKTWSGLCRKHRIQLCYLAVLCIQRSVFLFQ